MLLEAKQLAHASLLHVLFSQVEAILTVAYYLESCQRLRCIHSREQHAVGLLTAASYPTTQLVQLREAKALGILYHHQRSIGHIHAYLDNGGAHQNLGMACYKVGHNSFFFGRLEPTM